jgi:hypothetical protein
MLTNHWWSTNLQKDCHGRCTISSIPTKDHKHMNNGGTKHSNHKKHLYTSEIESMNSRTVPLGNPKVIGEESLLQPGIKMPWTHHLAELEHSSQGQNVTNLPCPPSNQAEDGSIATLQRHTHDFVCQQTTYDGGSGICYLESADSYKYDTLAIGRMITD